MKLIVGLGNPGSEYTKTRHNTGFVVVERLAIVKEAGWQKQEKFGAEVARAGEVLLVKPQTFMNASGKTVSKLANFYKIAAEDIYIVHDDLDLRMGDYKIQEGVGPKVHNGVESVERELGLKNFWRVRVGIDNRGEIRIAGEDYVLANFSTEEEEKLKEVVEKIVEELKNVG